jgi:hypothetical protein
MSSRELIGRYIVERGRPKVILPLAAALAATSCALGAAMDDVAIGFVSAFLRATVLILAFRIWDDLEDRDRDAVEHPERVVVRTTNRMPLVGFAIVLLAAGVASVVRSGHAAPKLASLLVAVVLLMVWYRLRPANAAGVLGGHIVLIKYPLIAAAITPTALSFGAAPMPWRAIAMLGSLYFALCLFEYADDPALRQSVHARAVALTELVLLIPLLTATVFSFGAGMS